MGGGGGGGGGVRTLATQAPEQPGTELRLEYLADAGAVVVVDPSPDIRTHAVGGRLVVGALDVRPNLVISQNAILAAGMRTPLRPNPIDILTGLGAATTRAWTAGRDETIPIKWSKHVTVKVDNLQVVIGIHYRAVNALRVTLGPIPVVVVRVTELDACPTGYGTT